MSEQTRLLLWTVTPGPYIDAIAAAGLAGRIAADTLARKDTPTQAHPSTPISYCRQSRP